MPPMPGPLPGPLEPAWAGLPPLCCVRGDGNSTDGGLCMLRPSAWFPLAPLPLPLPLAAPGDSALPLCGLWELGERTEGKSAAAEECDGGGAGAGAPLLLLLVLPLAGGDRCERGVLG